MINPDKVKHIIGEEIFTAYNCMSLHQLTKAAQQVSIEISFRYPQGNTEYMRRLLVEQEYIRYLAAQN